jgi:hypothetical protein
MQCYFTYKAFFSLLDKSALILFDRRPTVLMVRLIINFLAMKQELY